MLGPPLLARENPVTEDSIALALGSFLSNLSPAITAHKTLTTGKVKTSSSIILPLGEEPTVACRID